jgi:Mg2+-importing ATPase
MILICAAILSLFLQDTTDALIILAIVLTSGLLGFWQEHSAANAVSKLRSMVEVKARVLRDGVEKVVPIEDVVPGDLILSRGVWIWARVWRVWHDSKGSLTPPPL